MRYRLYGGMGSPYSMKMRAILRYRRLPHDWVVLDRARRSEVQPEGPAIIPILEFPDGERRVDSTPLALELEARHSERRIVPSDPAVAFLCHLLEDFGDEWCTKMMFHYRWFREIDQIYASRQIVADNTIGLEGEALERAAETIRERQVSRMPLVGCTAENAPVIEASFRRVLDALSLTAMRDRYLFGTRPSLADFAIFGQFKTLCDDHTPHLIVRSEYPRVYDWVRRLDDASGIDGQWGEPSPAARALLTICGDSYLPFLAANARAVEADEASFSVEIDGRRFSQGVFRYQLKCYRTLRHRFAALDSGDQARVTEWLAPTAILTYLTGED